MREREREILCLPFKSPTFYCALSPASSADLFAACILYTCCLSCPHSPFLSFGPLALVAGVGIQYLIPTALCYYARRKVTLESGSLLEDNPHRSWFRHPWWVFVVCTWALGAVGIVTFNHIYAL